MDVTNESNRTLKKNSINQFILRFDLMPDSEIDFITIINAISSNYDRTEKRIQPHIHINFVAPGQSEVKNTDEVDYVLIKESYRYSVTFSPLQKAFWFETTQYIDNSTYKNPILQIVKVLESHFPNIKSKRIGMRFLNEFHSPNIKNISKVFNSNISKSISSMASQENISRVIAQEEYNYSTSKLRVQYGIPNKFYPTVLNNFDLLLDIDSFDDVQHNIETWEATLIELNHAAYTKFQDIINPKFIEELK